MALDINFGRTQMMQRELQSQQDFTVAEIFGARVFPDADALALAALRALCDWRQRPGGKRQRLRGEQFRWQLAVAAAGFFRNGSRRAAPAVENSFNRRNVRSFRW